MNLVAVVASGAEALTAVDRMPIDVALLDVEMPGVSGVETAAVIRREHPEVTVVMLTAFERPGRLDEAIAAGVHGFRACQVVCVSGLVLDGLGESFGVAEGELVEGLCPALDGGALD